MAGGRIYLPDFLTQEGLLVEVRSGIWEACWRCDSSQVDELEETVWQYLNLVVVTSTRATTYYGIAFPTSRRLRITELPCSPGWRRDVIKHELAHLVAFRLYGGEIMPHGSEWRSVAQALGASLVTKGCDPVFAHAVRQIQESRLKIVARCSICGFEILKTRRTRKYDGGRYYHKGCGGIFEPVD